MNAIYVPKGPALEYAPLACNLFRGCLHGCKYCYAPGVLRMSRDEFSQPGKLRPGVLEQLEKDAAKYAKNGAKGPVLLCFTSDPFQSPECADVTAKAIRIINGAGLPVAVLTKGYHVRIKHFTLLRDGHRLNQFAVTLTFDEEFLRIKWEPSAARVGDRYWVLYAAHSLGIDTWASIEPVIIPAQSLACIKRAAPWVNEFRVGKWNHDKRAASTDWKKFHDDAVNLLESLGFSSSPNARKRYYIKEDLRRAAA